MHTKQFRRWALLLPAMLAIVAAFALVACGGGDDDDDGVASGGSQATGSDEKYVGQICKAMKTFMGDYPMVGSDKASPDLSSGSADDVDWSSRLT